MTQNENTRVATAVFVVSRKQKPGCVLIGRRKGSRLAGSWQLPGGHIDFQEPIEKASFRELKEETNLEPSGDKNDCHHVLTAISDIGPNVHYVVIFCCVELQDNAVVEPELCEPEKCEEWKWIEWSDMKEWAQQQANGTLPQEHGQFMPSLENFILNHESRLLPFLGTVS